MRPPGVNGAGDRKHSKTGRSVGPEDPGFGAPRVLPAVRGRAFEIEAITRLEKVAFALIQADFEFTAQHVEEFLALMGIRFAAATAGLDAEKMRFHGGVAPGEQLHANAGRSFQDFALPRADMALSVAVRFKQREEIDFLQTGNARL